MAEPSKSIRPGADPWAVVNRRISRAPSCSLARAQRRSR